MLWDLAEGKKLYSLEANETIHALCFSPNRYWLCAATDTAIKVGFLLERAFTDRQRKFQAQSGIRLCHMSSLFTSIHYESEYHTRAL